MACFLREKWLTKTELLVKNEQPYRFILPTGSSKPLCVTVGVFFSLKCRDSEAGSQV